MNKNTRENIILTAKNILSIIIITICGFLIVGFAKQKEPIQELVNQIELNQSKIELLEIQKAELKEANKQAKSELMNKYGLELSKAFTKNVEPKEESQDDSEICPADLFEKYERDCVNHLQDEWKPGKLSEDGTHQEMPVLTGSDSHERFKQLATAYGLQASQIRAVEEYYGIKEGVILCITIAETSGGNRGYGGKNIGSVGSNDRGDRPTYALMEAGLEAIGKTLNNGYLGSKKTLGCLSNAGSCTELSDNGKRYATSQSSREKNMVACLSDIYGPINASQFNIRR